MGFIYREESIIKWGNDELEINDWLMWFCRMKYQQL
jgi:hypothetical protein